MRLCVKNYTINPLLNNYNNKTNNGKSYVKINIWDLEYLYITRQNLQPVINAKEVYKNSFSGFVAMYSLFFMLHFNSPKI